MSCHELSTLRRAGSCFLFQQLDFGLGLQRKPATASLDDSHGRAFLLEASPEQDQSRFEIVF
jgi:hypothetical protein